MTYEQPRARSSDPWTSHNAASKVRVQTIYDTILMVLRARGDEGATTNELASITNIPLVSISPAMKPLEKLAKVKRTDDTRSTRPGTRPSIVWALQA